MMGPWGGGGLCPREGHSPDSEGRKKIWGVQALGGCMHHQKLSVFRLHNHAGRSKKFSDLLFWLRIFFLHSWISLRFSEHLRLVFGYLLDPRRAWLGDSSFLGCTASPGDSSRQHHRRTRLISHHHFSVVFDWLFV